MKLPRLLSGPALLWFSFFILAPLAIVCLVSFASRGTYGGITWHLDLTNYGRVFSADYLRILWVSLKLAAFTASSCLLVGLLAAWAMATASEKNRAMLLAMIALPFLTNLIIRVYAVKSVVGADGPLQFLLRTLHVPFDAYSLTANPTLVWYGMVSSYLPFSVLPLYGAFEKFDFTLVEAAQDLGAGSFRIFWTVIVPGLRQAVGGAFLLVFIPCLGEYVIPDLLGGAKTMLLGNLITEEFLRARDWPFGSALAVAMLGTLVLVLLVRQVFASRVGGAHE